MIDTENGDTPVEWLDTSDRVLTRDHGYQNVIWIERTTMMPAYFRQFPDECPVEFKAGSIAQGVPSRNLQLTGDHRVLICTEANAAQREEAEAFAPAKAWTDIDVARSVMPKKPYVLTHVLCADHQVIMADGLWVESLFASPETLRRLSPRYVDRVQTLLGEDLHGLHPARPCLGRKDAVTALNAMKAANAGATALGSGSLGAGN